MREPRFRLPAGAAVTAGREGLDVEALCTVARETLSNPRAAAAAAA